MRSVLISSFIGMVFYLFQAIDLVAIAREFGFPILVSGVLFVFFSRQLSKANEDKDNYRGQTIDLLEGLLKEAKAANVCRFEKQ